MIRALRKTILFILLNAEDIGALLMMLVLGAGSYLLMCGIIIAAG